MARPSGPRSWPSPVTALTSLRSGNPTTGLFGRDWCHPSTPLPSEPHLAGQNIPVLPTLHHPHRFEGCHVIQISLKDLHPGVLDFRQKSWEQGTLVTKLRGCLPQTRPLAGRSSSCLSAGWPQVPAGGVCWSQCRPGLLHTSRLRLGGWDGAQTTT